MPPVEEIKEIVATEPPVEEKETIESPANKPEEALDP